MTKVESTVCWSLVLVVQNIFLCLNFIQTTVKRQFTSNSSQIGCPVKLVNYDEHVNFRNNLILT